MPRASHSKNFFHCRVSSVTMVGPQYWLASSLSCTELAWRIALHLATYTWWNRVIATRNPQGQCFRCTTSRVCLDMQVFTRVNLGATSHMQNTTCRIHNQFRSSFGGSQFCEICQISHNGRTSVRGLGGSASRGLDVVCLWPSKMEAKT